MGNTVGLPACPKGNSLNLSLAFTQYGGRQPLDLTGVILAFIASKYLDGKSPPPVNIQWANHVNPSGGQSTLQIPGSLTETLDTGDYYFNITALNPDGSVATYASGTWPISPTPGTISGSAPTVPPMLGPGYIKEAPNDGQPYVRQAQAWAVNPVQEAPEDGKFYTRSNGVWTPTPGDVPEAPLVGGPYWRQNAGWVTDPIIEAPTDGQSYVRNHRAWLALVGYVQEAPTDGVIYGRHNGVWTSVPVGTNTLPLMDGAASAGTGTSWARADHVHPPDTSRIAVGATAGGDLIGSYPNPTLSTTGVTAGTYTNPTSITVDNRGRITAIH